MDKSQGDSAKEMTFWEHIDDLRKVLFKIAAVVIGLSVVFFCFMREIFDYVILAPCNSDFITYRMFDFIEGDGSFLPDLAGKFDIKLININLGTQFMTHMSSSMWLSFVFSFPIVIYLLWSFISPGLYERERRGARKAFIFGNIMFFLGVATGYFLVFPLSLRFLSQYELSASITNTLTLESYMDSLYTIAFGMGLLFELPLVTWMLGKAGLITRGLFTRFRRHAIVILLIVAAVVTPTSDIFTLFIVFLPLYLLWEFSAQLVPPAPKD
jgi:sec-independent protein translocase protein TatC